MLERLINNPLLLITTCILVGQVIGSLEVKHIKLGSSATLFIGLILSYMITSNMDINVKISSTIFHLSLVGFISSVGLIASKNIKQIIKSYGIKFLILAFVITGTGATSTYIFTNIIYNLKSSIIGTYVGALTSSPGLATALEIAKNMSIDQSANIGLGYSIAYIPGILLVIIFSQFMGKKKSPQITKEKINETKELELNFHLISFMLVIMLGIIIGSLKLKVNSTTTFSLGMTGGVLISALLLGSLKKIGKLSFEFDNKQLGVIRDISLNMFLAIVGLNYGYKAVSAVQQFGVELLFVGLVTGSLSIIVGYLIGKYILKIENVYLIGGICGGMTSTPGLAAAIDAFESEDVVSGYGATYPFALFFMIVFTNILFIAG